MIRKKIWILLLITLLPCLSQHWLNAQEDAPDKAKEPVAVKPATGEITPMTREWNDRPLREVLQVIAEHAGINIIPDLSIDDEKDKVTMQINNMEWPDVLTEVAIQTKCTIKKVKENLYRISKPIRLEVDFENAPLQQIVRYIANQANINIILTPDVKGTVTLKVSEVPWPDLLDSVVKSAGFIVVKEKNDVIRIVKPSELKKQLETKIFKFKYLQPPSAYTAKIETAYAVGTPKAVTDPLTGFTVLTTLRSMLTPGLGRLDYDDVTNSIIVTDIKPVIDKMGKILNQLDVEPSQILIEVKFINTTNTDLLDFGMRYAWGDDKGWTVTTVPHSIDKSWTDRPFLDPKEASLEQATQPLSRKFTRQPFGLGSQKPQMNQYFLTQYDVKATLRLFKGDDTSKLVQAPSVIALDGRTTTIFVGEEIRYAQTTASGTQAGGITYSIGEASNSPVKVGFQLLVVPNIVAGANKVMMTVIPQDEFLSGNSSDDLPGFDRFTITGSTTQSIDLPRIRQSTIITQMIVESGRTAVIGGLAIDRHTRTEKKIPFLGDIPVLGWFFKHRSNTNTKNHMLVYITPTILKSASNSMKIMQDKVDQTNTVKLKKLKR